jgi:hypothetical protein
MAGRTPTRRDVLRAGAALLAVGTAGCEAILSGETGTPTEPSAASTPSPTGSTRGPTASPTETARDPTISSTPSPPPSPTDTPGAPAALTRLTPADGASGQDYFGQSTAIGDDTALVGAPGTGAVHVFTVSGPAWTRTAELTAGEDGLLGTSLALAGETLLAGAPASDADANPIGSAHVFRRTDGEWHREARLMPTFSESPGFLFGRAVALVGSRAVVGAPRGRGPDGRRTGAAYVFERGDEDWRLEAKLAPDDAEAGAGFGTSLATDEGILLVGAPESFAPAGDVIGSVYAFERADGAWRRTGTLVPGTASPGAAFGVDVALAGGTVLVGAPGDDRGSGLATGVTYVAERSGDGWQATTGLVPGDSDAGYRFGSTVELTANAAFVGTSSISTGSVYVFGRSGGIWTRLVELGPGSAPVNGGFGSAIAAADGTAVIGAPRAGENTGAAFVADLDRV